LSRACISRRHARWLKPSLGFVRLNRRRGCTSSIATLLLSLFRRGPAERGRKRARQRLPSLRLSPAGLRRTGWIAAANPRGVAQARAGVACGLSFARPEKSSMKHRLPAPLASSAPRAAGARPICKRHAEVEAPAHGSKRRPRADGRAARLLPGAKLRLPRLSPMCWRNANPAGGDRRAIGYRRQARAIGRPAFPWCARC